MAVHVMRGDMKIDADLQIAGTVNADLQITGTVNAILRGYYLIIVV